MTTRTRHAQALFEGIAPEYEWMGGVLSFGQDPRWRRFLVSRVDAPRGASELDVATGTSKRQLHRARMLMRKHLG